jgi:SAM-dependent methyltransferase
MVMSTHSDQLLSAEVIWHDLECGSYSADLPLWRELAEAAAGPVLDVGAGTGRVTLDLGRAQADRRVTALDLDPVLLSALRERAAGLDVETVCADARSFRLLREDFALCLVPMQTIQLLSDDAERAVFLCCARAHLRPGGLLACAIVTELEPFDLTAGFVGPSPETVHVGDALYVSRATSVRVLPERIAIERMRRIIAFDSGQSSERHPISGADGERNVVELARVSASELEDEGSKVGFHPEPAVAIEPTDEHVGSVVVMLRA